MSCVWATHIVLFVYTMALKLWPSARDWYCMTVNSLLNVKYKSMASIPNRINKGIAAPILCNLQRTHPPSTLIWNNDTLKPYDTHSHSSLCIYRMLSPSQLAPISFLITFHSINLVSTFSATFNSKIALFINTFHPKKLNFQWHSFHLRLEMI